jgi:hypothetical protein
MNESIIPPRVVGTPEREANADSDPELAALLRFRPVPRLVNRPDGWTPERQRRFLELIVQTGSPQQAARAMRKQLSGIEAVYRDDDVGEFRASWDGICELVRTREMQRLKCLDASNVHEPPHRGEVPGVTRRKPKSSASPRRGGGRGPFVEDEREGEGQDADDQWATAMTLFQRYAMKLQLERQERHRGNIAAADFYLRQATFIEVCMDVTGLFPLLRQAGIGEHELLAIAETPLTRILADVRRAVWSDAGEPERPAPPQHLLIDHGDCRTMQDEATGKAARVGPWIDAEEWRTLDNDRQRQRLKQQHEADAEAYRRWIERATAAWRERPDSVAPPAEAEEPTDEDYRRRWFGEE